MQGFSHTYKDELEEVLRVLVKITSRTPEQIKPYLDKLLGQLVVSENETIVATERRKAFQEWVESHRDLQLPLLSDHAISRESIYGERG
ncbi:MAG: hypothetical protein F6J86_34545 [Symploca sp. SIO1B1]|nr:hypothetical protein [Symploca sp. SIO1C2]NER98891.1 hypothetical protein [Symploca sp. SIO1B1]